MPADLGQWRLRHQPWTTDRWVLSRSNLAVTFDDERLVADAGLVLPATSPESSVTPGQTAAGPAPPLSSGVTLLRLPQRLLFYDIVALLGVVPRPRGAYRVA